MKVILTMGMVILCQLMSIAQKIQRISPGMMVPDIVLKGFLGKNEKHITLRDFKGELLILDFWNTSCGSCIEAMPELDSLQREFGDKVSMLMATRNSAAEVKKLFSHIKIRQPSIPMIVADTLLPKYFPHSSVPHHVWIGKDGIVKFITYGYNTTGKNIRAYLAGEELHLHFKNEEPDFDFQAPLLSVIDGSLLKNIQQYSVITNRVDEYGGGASGLILDSAHNQFGVKLLNSSLLEMYKTAYGEAIGGGRFSFNNRVLLEVSKPEKFLFPSNSDTLDQWISDNVFGYEARIKNGSQSMVFTLMRQDLASHFPYRAYAEFRNVKSYVLVKIPGPDMLATKNQDATPDSGENKLRNMPFKTLANWLLMANLVLPYPVSIEYEYEGRIDFDFPDKPANQLLDLETIKKALHKAGLDLVIKDKLQEMLIIHDR